MLNFCVICKIDIISNDTNPSGDTTSMCPFCNSLFHSSHLLKWLAKKSSCPNCRQEMHKPFTSSVRKGSLKFKRICDIQFHLKLRRGKKSRCYQCGRIFDYPKIEFIQSNVINDSLNHTSNDIAEDKKISLQKNPLEVNKSGTQVTRTKIPIHRTFKTEIYKFDESPYEKYKSFRLNNSHDHFVRRTEVNVITILIMYTLVFIVLYAIIQALSQMN